MTVVCIDLEGVLIPEIWQSVAKSTDIAELQLTTRDIANYDELMDKRLQILREHSLTIDDITAIIVQMECLSGAQDFLAALRRQREVIIVSDTFYQFSAHFMAQLDWPTLFCNDLSVDSSGNITGYHLRQKKDGKKNVIRGLTAMGFDTYATGDSYNDLGMVLDAMHGSFFCPPKSISAQYPQVLTCHTYEELLSDILIH